MNQKTSVKGFTLIELLVVIAIIAILAAILFPVFARAREKARATTCSSNQRQIAASIQMYVQDHEETFPSTTTIWSDIKVDPGVLVCPTKGKATPNGYGYISSISGTGIGEISDPTTMPLTGDCKSTTNLITSITDLENRHSNATILSYADGHVATQQNVSIWQIPNISLFLKLAASGTTLAGQTGWTLDWGTTDPTGANGLHSMKSDNTGPGKQGVILSGTPWNYPANAQLSLSAIGASPQSTFKLLVLSGNIRMNGVCNTSISLKDSANKKIFDISHYATTPVWTYLTKVSGVDISTKITTGAARDTGWLPFTILCNGVTSIYKIGSLTLTDIPIMTGSNFQTVTTLEIDDPMSQSEGTSIYVDNLKIGYFN